MAGNDEAVAAVIAPATEDEHARRVREPPPRRPGDGAACLFHQQKKGNACLRGLGVGGGSTFLAFLLLAG